MKEKKPSKILKLKTQQIINFKKILYKGPSCRIKIDKIKPFRNICLVTNLSENCNLEIDYVPYKYVVEMGSYRDYFKQNFNLLIEDLASKIFRDFNRKIKPKQLKVTLYMTDELLTPWSVEIKK